MGMASKPTILIADDEASIRNMLKLRLEASGFRCLVASTGREAVQIAKEKRPDLVILDLKMPDMDGDEAYKILKEDPETRNTRFIFFTARDPRSIMDKGIETIDELDFIFKPFDDTALSLLIRSALGSLPS